MVFGLDSTRIMILLENLNGYLVSKIMVFSCLVDIGSKGVGCSIVVARSDFSIELGGVST